MRASIDPKLSGPHQQLKKSGGIASADIDHSGHKHAARDMNGLACNVAG